MGCDVALLQQLLDLALFEFLVDLETEVMSSCEIPKSVASAAVSQG
jgi:hypothetical protein